jgi:glyoxylase-like metal-dependent hydrolase (beta-lactamase superfamily II)
MDIHALFSRIANIYIVVNENGVVIVDAGFGNAAPIIIKKIRELRRAPSDVRLIFLTHAHMDHVGGAAELRRLTGAPIALHRADIAKARAGKHNLPSGRGSTGKALEHTFNGLHLKFRYEAFEPDLFFDEGDTLREFGLNARVLRTPGHTLGSLTLALPERALLVGDAIINQFRVAMPLYGEDIALAFDSVRKIAELQPRILYSGHGKPFSGAALARYTQAKKLSLAAE